MENMSMKEQVDFVREKIRQANLAVGMSTLTKKWTLDEALKYRDALLVYYERLMGLDRISRETKEK